MKTKIVATACMIAVVLASTVIISPTAHARSKSERIFYYYTNTDGLKSVKKNYKQIDILAPQIYTVGYDNKLSKPSDTEVLDVAKQKDIDVMPLIVNANFNRELMSGLLSDIPAQDTIITQMITEADEHGFIGWQFDFENISHRDRDLYAQFVERTYKAMQKEGLLFSVAVIPRRTPYNPNASYQDWSSGYDIGTIAKVSDFVSIMSYDDPRSKGPVASLDFVYEVLDETLKTTPAEKISLGIPLYCWQWHVGIESKIASVTYPRAKAAYKKFKKKPRENTYDKSIGAELFFFTRDTNNQNFIWCDNAESIKAKERLVEGKGLRGISAWAIGQEDPKIWKALK